VSGQPRLDDEHIGWKCIPYIIELKLLLCLPRLASAAYNPNDISEQQFRDLQNLEAATYSKCYTFPCNGNGWSECQKLWIRARHDQLVL
jgi:hypothetical protein